MAQIEIWGWDKTNEIARKILVDDNGKLIISDVDPFEIVQDIPEDLKHVPHGYYAGGPAYLPFKVDVDGVLQVAIAALANLGLIDDVNLAGLADGDVIVWDDGAGEWVPAGISDWHTAALHETGGAAEPDVTDLAGLLADGQTPLAHKDSHDPNDGADKLDTAIAVKVGDANAIGTSHSLARADHVHEKHHAKYTNGEAVSAVEAAGLDLASGKNIKLIKTLTANNTRSGITTTFTAGASILYPYLIRVDSSGEMRAADADEAATMPAIGIACEATAIGNSGEVLLLGFFRYDGWDWTPGGLLYVSCDIGDLTQTAPVGSGDQVQVVGVAITADIIYFNPSYELVEIS